MAENENEKIGRLIDNMEPHMNRWAKEFGTVIVTKALAAYMVQAAGDQPSPDRAIDDLVFMISDMHATNKAGHNA